MRLIQAMIPRGSRQDIEAMLKQQEQTYSLLEQSGSDRFSHVVLIPIGKGEVEQMVELLEQNGLKRDGTIVITEAEAIISEAFEQKQEEEPEPEASAERIAEEEIVSRARELSRSTTNYILFTIISAVVATAGLLADSASIVVGSMVIAPLIGPAMASSVGSVVNDPKLFREGLWSQFLGTVIAIASATGFAFLTRLHMNPELNLLLFDQIAERVHPGLLSLAVALGAGTAGALSMTSGMSAALVGVMIAVALIPPAATVGLGLAYFEPHIAFSASVLVALNLLCINLSAIVTLWIKGYRPDTPFEVRISRFLNARRIGFLLVGILLISGLLFVTTVQNQSNRKLEASVRQYLRQQNLPIHEVQIEYKLDLLYQVPSKVIIRTHTENNQLPDNLKRYLRREVDTSVPVVVISENRLESS